MPESTIPRASIVIPLLKNLKINMLLLYLLAQDLKIKKYKKVATKSINLLYFKLYIYFSRELGVE